MMKNGSNIEAWRGEIIIADSFSAWGTPHGIAPRVYCAANPLRYVDPTGMALWFFNDQGYSVRIPFKLADLFVTYSTSDSGPKKLNAAIFLPNTFTTKRMHGGTVIESKSENSNRRLFEFLSENTSVEWGSFKTVDNEDVSNYKTATSHESEECGILTDLLNDAFRSKYEVDEITHSHPNNTPYPSNTIDTDRVTGKKKENGDIPSAKEIDTKIGYTLVYHIYLPETHQYVHYSSDGVRVINYSPLNKPE